MAEQTIIIKKRRSHGTSAHHGGSWKVAYADFVTAMWAFFMVMWIMGLSDDIKMQIQGYFNDPLGFQKNQPRFKSPFSLKGTVQQTPGIPRSKDRDRTKQQAESEAYKLKNKLGAVMKADAMAPLMKNVEMTVTEEGLRIELLESAGAVFFDSGHAVIRPKAMELIKHIAPILAKTGQRMIIEGHTDAKPYPGVGYTNWDLSSDRALALRRALADGGVADSQFMSVRGLAATELRDPDNPYHFSNRRVTILLPYPSMKDADVDLPLQDMKSHVDGIFREPVLVAPKTGPLNVAH